jgi:hypothetical protein
MSAWYGGSMTVDKHNAKLTVCHNSFTKWQVVSRPGNKKQVILLCSCYQYIQAVYVDINSLWEKGSIKTGQPDNVKPSCGSVGSKSYWVMFIKLVVRQILASLVRAFIIHLLHRDCSCSMRLFSRALFYFILSSREVEEKRVKKFLLLLLVLLKATYVQNKPVHSGC